VTAATPDLPVTFRPLWGRVIPYVLAVVAVVSFSLVAVTVTGDGRAGARVLDRVLLLAFGVLVAAALCRFGSVRIAADAEGLRVRNLFSSRRLEWAEVVAVRLAPGDPWVQLDLSDGTTLPAMGIQGSDGGRASAQAVALAALVDERSAAG
jgi:hypothetical protein